MSIAVAAPRRVTPGASRLRRRIAKDYRYIMSRPVGRWVVNTMLAGAMAAMCGTAVPLMIAKRKRWHVAFGLALFAAKLYMALAHGMWAGTRW